MNKFAKKHKFRILAEFTTAILGGTMLGITGFIVLMTFGGNYGCLSIVDKLTGLQGYESCGEFGTIAGTILGSLIGFLLIKFSRRSEKSYKQIAIITALATIAGPSIIGFGMFGSSLISDTDTLIPVLVFTAFEIIASALVTLILAFIAFLISKITKFFRRK